MNDKTLAILWRRIGPYHAARIHALEAACSERAIRLHNIEIANDDQYAWEQRNDRDEVAITTLFPNHYDSNSNLSIFVQTWRALNRIRPQFLVLNGWGTAESWAGWAWSKYAGDVVRIVVSETLPPVKPGAIRERLKEAFISECDGAVVGGKKHAAYVESLGMDGSKVAAGYDVVDNSHFASSAEAARSDATQERSNRGLPEKYFFVCSRFLKRKNLARLLKAYGIYREQTNDEPWGMVIAGGERSSLAEIGINDNEANSDGVKWAGFLQYDELPVYYGLASAFIHPALAEAWGLVVNEAAAASLPLLVSNTVGAASELVEPGQNGFLFDPTDSEAIAEGMLKISAMSKNARADMGSASAKQVSRFTPDRFASAVVQLIGNLGQW